MSAVNLAIGKRNRLVMAENPRQAVRGSFRDKFEIYIRYVARREQPVSLMGAPPEFFQLSGRSRRYWRFPLGPGRVRF